MRISRPRLLATLVALSALTLTMASSAQAAAPRDFYGVVPQTPLSTADFDRMGQGRVGTLRSIIFWASVDPSPAPGDYQWGDVDAVVGNAARNGVEVLPFVYGTPDWVAQGIDGKSCGSQCALFAPRSAAALAAWRTFVTDLVARYGPGGQFWVENPTLPQVPIEAWQVWNEQNSPTFYKPKPNVKAYAKLLDAAAAAIRSVDPNGQVVLGGMAELAGVGKAIKGAAYLQKLYRRPGAKQDFDGVAPHPYGARLKKVQEQIELIRDVLKKGRDRGADLYVTEIGWGSEQGGNPLNRGPQGQAARLRQAFKYFTRKRGALNVQMVTWFSWMDSQQSICDWCAKSGLFAPGLVEKPAWRAFVKFTGGS